MLFGQAWFEHFSRRFVHNLYAGTNRFILVLSRHVVRVLESGLVQRALRHETVGQLEDTMGLILGAVTQRYKHIEISNVYLADASHKAVWSITLKPLIFFLLNFKDLRNYPNNKPNLRGYLLKLLQTKNSAARHSLKLEKIFK